MGTPDPCVLTTRGALKRFPHSSPASTRSPQLNRTFRKYCLHGRSASSLQSRLPDARGLSIHLVPWPAHATPPGASPLIPFLAGAPRTPSVLPPTRPSPAAPRLLDPLLFRGFSALRTRVSPAFPSSLGRSWTRPLPPGSPLGCPRDGWTPGSATPLRPATGAQSPRPGSGRPEGLFEPPSPARAFPPRAGDCSLHPPHLEMRARRREPTRARASPG